ncbi:MAG: hypothetical protein V7K67_23640 [Nostoc sp.]|uniref:hypothetical protein n=1 Tax=Nostoc sp. TaxID=1180 RepID=UPI002FF907D5
MSDIKQPEHLIQSVLAGYDSLKVENSSSLILDSQGENFYQDDSTNRIYIISTNYIYELTRNQDGKPEKSDTKISFNNPKSIYIYNGDVYYVSKQRKWISNVSIKDFSDSQVQGDVDPNARIQRDTNGNIYTLTWSGSKAKFRQYTFNPQTELFSQDKQAVLYLVDNEPSPQTISKDVPIKYYFNLKEQKYYSLTKGNKWESIEPNNVPTEFSINLETGIISIDNSSRNIYSNYSVDFQKDGDGDFSTFNEVSLLIDRGNGYVSVGAIFFIVNEKGFRKIYPEKITKKIDDFAIDLENAYLISDGSFYVYSLSEFKLVSSYKESTGGFTSVAKSGKFAFLIGSNHSLTAINLFDKRNPAKAKDFLGDIRGTKIRFFEDRFFVFNAQKLSAFEIKGIGNTLIVNAAVGIGTNTTRGALDVVGKTFLEELYLSKFQEGWTVQVGRDGKLECTNPYNEYDNHTSPKLRLAGELLIFFGDAGKTVDNDKIKVLASILRKIWPDLAERIEQSGKTWEKGWGRFAPYLYLSKVVRTLINGLILSPFTEQPDVELARKVLIDLDSIFTNAGIASNCYGIAKLNETVGLDDQKRISLLGNATAKKSVAIGHNTKVDKENAVVIGVGYPPDDNHNGAALHNPNQSQMVPASTAVEGQTYEIEIMPMASQELMPHRHGIINGVIIQAKSDHPSITVYPGQKNEAGSVGIGKSASALQQGENFVTNSIAIGSYTQVKESNAVVIGFGKSLEEPLTSKGEKTIVLGVDSEPYLTFKQREREEIEEEREEIEEEREEDLQRQVIFNANILPAQNSQFKLTLGNSSNRFKGIYVTGSSLHIGTKEKEGTIGFNTTSEKLTLNAAKGIITQGIQFTDPALLNCDPTFKRLYTDEYGNLRCGLDVSKIAEVIRYTITAEEAPPTIKKLLQAETQVKQEILEKLGVKKVEEISWGNLRKLDKLALSLKDGSIQDVSKLINNAASLEAKAAGATAATALTAATAAGATAATALTVATAAETTAVLSLAAAAAAGATAVAALAIAASSGKANEENTPKFQVRDKEPLSNEGNKGDFYLHQQTGDLYVKEEKWRIVGNIRQPNIKSNEVQTKENTPKFQVGDKLPSSNEGNKGDFYLHQQTGDLYTKGSESWEKVRSIHQSIRAESGFQSSKDDSGLLNDEGSSVSSDHWKPVEEVVATEGERLLDGCYTEKAVGIGTANPKALLHVCARDTNSTSNANELSTYAAIFDGFVGIGRSPTRAALDIRLSLGKISDMVANRDREMNVLPSKLSLFSRLNHFDYSVFADRSIAALEFHALCDERIKNTKGIRYPLNKSG